MRSLMVLAAIMAMTIYPFAYANDMGPEPRNLLNSTLGTDLLVSGTETLYTLSFSLRDAEHFGIAYQPASVGSTNPSVAIRLQESWVAPVTEGSSDENWTTPVGMAEIHNGTLTVGQWYLESVSPVVAPLARIQIVGNTANTASQMNLKIIKK